MHIILKHFSKEALWKELMERETFEDVSGQVEAALVWRSVFNRTPELSAFLKRREILLLKGTALNDKPNQFVLGQIAENRLWQRFDTVQDRQPEKVIEKKIQTLPLASEFLKRVKEPIKVEKKDDGS